MTATGPEPTADEVDDDLPLRVCLVDAIRLFANGSSQVGQPSSLDGIDPFWHYTDTSGLLGIIESQELWASGISRMNDPDELEYGLDILTRVWNEDFQPSPGPSARAYVDTLFGNEIRNALWGMVHVLSACCEGDNLAMWHHYGTSDGFAVGLSHQHLALRHRNGTITEQRTFWERVIYDEEEQRQLANDLIRTLIQMVPTSKDTDLVTRGKRTQMVLLLAAFVAAVKHPAYAHEREVRAIVTGCTPELKMFRATPRGVASYVRMVGAGETVGASISSGLRIDSIVCGPTVSEESAMVVREMLTAHSLRVDVTLSSLPFRG